MLEHAQHQGGPAGVAVAIAIQVLTLEDPARFADLVKHGVDVALHQPLRPLQRDL